MASPAYARAPAECPPSVLLPPAAYRQRLCPVPKEELPCKEAEKEEMGRSAYGVHSEKGHRSAEAVGIKSLSLGSTSLQLYKVPNRVVQGHPSATAVPLPSKQTIVCKCPCIFLSVGQGIPVSHRYFLPVLVELAHSANRQQAVCVYTTDVYIRSALWGVGWAEKQLGRSNTQQRYLLPARRARWQR